MIGSSRQCINTSIHRESGWKNWTHHLHQTSPEVHRDLHHLQNLAHYVVIVEYHLLERKTIACYPFLVPAVRVLAEWLLVGSHVVDEINLDRAKKNEERVPEAWKLSGLRWRQRATERERERVRVTKRKLKLEHENINWRVRKKFYYLSGVWFWLSKRNEHRRSDQDSQKETMNYLWSSYVIQPNQTDWLGEMNHWANHEIVAVAIRTSPIGLLFSYCNSWRWIYFNQNSMYCCIVVVNII